MPHDMAMDKINVREGWNIRESETDIDDLMESMSTVGQMNPIVVNENNELVAGHRRYLAAKRLGWQSIMAIGVDDPEKERLMHIDENLVRKDLTKPEMDKALSEKYAIYKKLVMTGKKSSDEFINDAVRQTGMSKSSIYRGVKRHDNASDAVWEAYCDEEIGSVQMDELIKIPKKDQTRILSKAKRLSAGDTKALINEEIARMQVPPDFAVRHPLYGTMHVTRFLKLYTKCSEKMLDLIECFDNADIFNMINSEEWERIESYAEDIRNGFKGISPS